MHLALLLRRTPLGDADLIVEVLTPDRGRISALARSARRSHKRFGGALEPFHRLRLRLEERPRSSLGTLKEAAIDAARTRLLRSLDAMQAAGRGLAWARRTTVEAHPEPDAFVALDAFLQQLDDEPEAHDAHLAALGLKLLVSTGLGLELTCCVRTGRPCRDGQAAELDPVAGGIVSRAAGGGPMTLTGDERQRLMAAQAGDEDTLDGPLGRLTISIVDGVLDAHGTEKFSRKPPVR